MLIVHVKKGIITKYSGEGIGSMPYSGWDSKKWHGWCMQLFVDGDM